MTESFSKTSRVNGNGAPAANVRFSNPVRNEYSDEQLRLAARLYYIDGLSQTAVADFVKVSQAKISRLLTAARERGIVRISVAEYEPRNQQLEKQLHEQFGLSTVAVIKTVEGSNSDDSRRTVAHFGSTLVSSLIPPNSVVAIAGGRTMYELVHHLPEDKSRRVTVIQAMGSVDSNIGPVDASELGRAMAQRMGGFFLTMNSPAFVPDKRTRDAFLSLGQIRSIWQRLSEANVALIGVGTLDNSVFVDRGVLSASDFKKLAERGAVGEICGRFFDNRGRECDSPWRDCVIGIELEHLRRTPQVIGMVSGADRSAAIIAAIRGGLLKSLIIDVSGALALLEASKPLKSKTK